MLLVKILLIIGLLFIVYQLSMIIKELSIFIYKFALIKEKDLLERYGKGRRRK